MPVILTKDVAEVIEALDVLPLQPDLPGKKEVLEEAPALPIKGYHKWETASTVPAMPGATERLGSAAMQTIEAAEWARKAATFEADVPALREPVYITAFSRYPEEYRECLLTCESLAPCRDAMAEAACALELPSGVKIFCEPWQYSVILLALAPLAHYFRPYHVICTERFQQKVTEAVQGLRRTLKVNTKWRAVCLSLPLCSPEQLGAATASALADAPYFQAVIANQQDAFLERLTTAMMADSHHQPVPLGVPLATLRTWAPAEEHRGCSVQAM